MKKSDRFSQFLQRKLNTTNFKLSNFFAAFGFFIFFSEIMYKEKILGISDISVISAIDIILVAHMVIFVIINSKKSEKIFLEKNERPETDATFFKTVFTFLLILDLISLSKDMQLIRAFSPLIFGSLCISAFFLGSTPLKVEKAENKP